jgi:hypothetical protein
MVDGTDLGVGTGGGGSSTSGVALTSIVLEGLGVTFRFAAFVFAVGTDKLFDGKPLFVFVLSAIVFAFEISDSEFDEFKLPITIELLFVLATVGC